MSRKIGYARSAIAPGPGHEDVLDNQFDALRVAGCAEIYSDAGKLREFPAPGLAMALEDLKTGDTFVVVDINRISRRMLEVAEVMSRLKEKGTQVRFLS